MGSPFTPVADRMKVYDMVRDAVSAGRFSGSTDFIRSNKGCGFAMPSRKTVRRWALGETSPFSGKNLFVARPSEELSLFLGIWIGDGWSDDNDGGKRLLLKVRSRTMAEEFAAASSKLLAKTKPYRVRINVDERGPWYTVKVTSFQLYDFVTQPLENLMEFIEPYPEAFLRGFYTVEGNPEVSVQQRRVPELGVGVCVSNSDHQLLQLSRNLLSSLGFHAGRIRLGTPAGKQTNVGIARKDNWMMNLSRLSEVQEFARDIGFADSDKQQKLDDAVSNLKQYGRARAAEKWLESYCKVGGAWVRKSGQPIAA